MCILKSISHPISKCYPSQTCIISAQPIRVHLYVCSNQSVRPDLGLTTFSKLHIRLSSDIYHFMNWQRHCCIRIWIWAPISVHSMTIPFPWPRQRWDTLPTVVLWGYDTYTQLHLNVESAISLDLHVSLCGLVNQSFASEAISEQYICCVCGHRHVCW